MLFYPFVKVFAMRYTLARIMWINIRAGLIQKAPLLLALAVFLVIGTACAFFESENPFPDSYYSTNFIETLGFDLYEGDNPAVPGIDPETGLQIYVTGSWDMSYRYTDWDTAAYIGFERATPTAIASDYSAVPVSLDPDAPVYRLEVANLVAGGHFESGISGTWGGTGGSAHDNTSRLTGTGSMRLDADSDGEITFTPVIAGFTTRAALSYSVFFRYASLDYFNARLEENLMALNDTTGRASGQFLPSSDGALPGFAFTPVSATSSFTNLYVDDFLMTRSGGMTLRLRLRPNETVLPLESGTYEFSVWVHTDPSSDVAGDTGPYPLSAFTISMKAVGNAVLAVNSGSYAPSAGWQRVSAVLSGQALQYPREDATTNEPVLDLVLEFENIRPGSVLLAAPELRFK